MTEKQETRAKALEIAVEFLGTSVQSGNRLNPEAVKEVEKYADLFLEYISRP
jgi:hypothetical protein